MQGVKSISTTGAMRCIYSSNLNPFSQWLQSQGDKWWLQFWCPTLKGYPSTTRGLSIDRKLISSFNDFIYKQYKTAFFAAIAKFFLTYFAMKIEVLHLSYTSKVWMKRGFMHIFSCINIYGNTSMHLESEPWGRGILLVLQMLILNKQVH
jgi:hypothetical protein